MCLLIKLCTHAELNCFELIICIKMDLALNNLQGLICHETQTTNHSIVEFLNSSILFHGTLIGTTTPDQSRPESNGCEEVLRIPQCSSITGTSPSDCLVSYPEHSLVGWGFYPSAELRSVDSTAPADGENR